ncbi:ABC transporter ATP-binding protein [Arenicella sp. 4NH20-0111]|uniref:ABC transporter ATP-binding protein n=1 Tax=Arenicella sp. 4NH20-0111 TaxID=3127648 RepID=UPI003101FC22
MIEVENIWKQYKLGATVEVGKTFREALSQKLTRKPATTSLDSRNQHFWALSDINLSIDSGRTLGLIGHNGAGKSTLLKILSRITKPTKGQIRIQGSLSSLLEVGTGFHPELSGRENIFLYGSIMGMSRRDIEHKLDQIVDYAGVEKFLDTPVKRYSSGMYVRLAFSIAAHVEPDILVVDEVLAVGDKEFREKCLGKMDDVAQSGRTVIFVSHNMNAIASLCQDVAWLDRGKIAQVGPAHSIISSYENSLIKSTASERASMLFNGSLSEAISLQQLIVQGVDNSYSVTIRSDEVIRIKATWLVHTSIEKLVMNMALYHRDTRLITLQDVKQPENAAEGSFTTVFEIPANTFNNADLTLAIGGKELANGRWCWAEGVARLNLVSDGLQQSVEAGDIFSAFGKGTREAG